MLPFDEVDVLGVNCAFGPIELTETVRYIAAELAAACQRAAQRRPADHGRRQELSR
jgi:methionine synthase I (cobalamin-dependent)